MSQGSDTVSRRFDTADEAELRRLLAGLTAVRDGDFGTRLPADRDGLLGEISVVFNSMVDQLSLFNSEVTRVAREVGTNGRLGGQAQVPGMVGAWRELTDSVNLMADNLTVQVRAIARVVAAVARGDLTRTIDVDARGEILELKTSINTMVDQLSSFADEVTRVAREVGTDGRLGGQADVKGVSGTWKDLTESVNVMGDNLTAQVRAIAQVTTAVARGDLTQKIRVDARGEILELKETINTMVDQLSSFADEVTRVAREVGTDGRLGGQARVPNVAGTWKDLTDNVNSMAGNLTSQVRNIAQVTTAVARGDLTRKIDVDARGEILELKTTINTMVDQLSSFADEVTRVAREVGREGRLGGQAEVEGVSGTWRRLTQNVNELAGNLTRQVRAIGEVASAVAEGDLTRSITVDASGEVAELKDNINTMVRSLYETTRTNQEQDWLKSNLARMSGLMQNSRDLAVVAELLMDELTPLVHAQYGAFYLTVDEPGGPVLELVSGYGLPDTAPDGPPPRFRWGQSLVGQAARSRRTIAVDGLPPDYVAVSSGLGRSVPTSLVVLPVMVEEQVLGVLELASVRSFAPVHRDFLEQLMEVVGVNVNAILANARTDELLGESQRLAQELRARTEELQARQEELQRSNAELQEKAALLASQNHDIETKTLEIEQARHELETRAQELSLASRYKSEFLANMSHELRTPLNSLLILAQLLAQNPGRNLTPKQVEYAEVIHSAGSDLLELINDILDLSKIEAGKMELSLEPVPLRQLVEYADATFRPLTVQKGLDFRISTDPGVPESLVTDDARLRQVLRNLLSNAVKFTESGGVELRIEPAVGPKAPASVCAHGPALAISVSDTGIGIAEQQLASIFEAFQQADGTTSRKYGGTGLGLSISREIADLLGGAITVASTVGTGSTFTLYLPATRPGPTGGGDPTPRLRPRLLVLENHRSGLLSLVAQSAATDVAAPSATPPPHRPAEVVEVLRGDAAADALAAGPFRCAVLDLDIPAGEALRFLEAVADRPGPSTPPVLAHHGTPLRPDHERALREYARIRPLEVLSSLDQLHERITLHLAAESADDVPPLPRPDSAPAAAGDGEADRGPLRDRTVLIVDDDVRNVFALTGILELHGMRVLHAENGRAGIEVLQRTPGIDLVLMDVMMPELDGYAATSAIRAMPEHAHLPVIAVTAQAMHGDREKSLASGADDHITKPVDARELIDRIHHWIDG